MECGESLGVLGDQEAWSCDNDGDLGRFLDDWERAEDGDTAKQNDACVEGVNCRYSAEEQLGGREFE